MSSICSLGPSKTRSFPIKVRVICVPGRYDICISIGININILIVFMIDILISVRLLGSDFFSRSLISKKEQSSLFHRFHCKSCPWFHSLVPPNHFYHLFSGRCERWHQRETTGTLGKKRLPRPSNGSTTSIRVEFNTTNPMVPFQKWLRFYGKNLTSLRYNTHRHQWIEFFQNITTGKQRQEHPTASFMCAKV